jgi:hypothetical protein
MSVEFHGLNSDILQRTKLFIVPAVRNSDPSTDSKFDMYLIFGLERPEHDRRNNSLDSQNVGTSFAEIQR